MALTKKKILQAIADGVCEEVREIDSEVDFETLGFNDDDCRFVYNELVSLFKNEGIIDDDTNEEDFPKIDIDLLCSGQGLAKSLMRRFG